MYLGHRRAPRSRGTRTQKHQTNSPSSVVRTLNIEPWLNILNTSVSGWWMIQLVWRQAYWIRWLSKIRDYYFPTSIINHSLSEHKKQIKPRGGGALQNKSRSGRKEIELLSRDRKKSKLTQGEAKVVDCCKLPSFAIYFLAKTVKRAVVIYRYGFIETCLDYVIEWKIEHEEEYIHCIQKSKGSQHDDDAVRS